MRMQFVSCVTREQAVFYVENTAYYSRLCYPVVRQ